MPTKVANGPVSTFSIAVRDESKMLEEVELAKAGDAARQATAIADAWESLRGERRSRVRIEFWRGMVGPFVDLKLSKIHGIRIEMPS